MLEARPPALLGCRCPSSLFDYTLRCIPPRCAAQLAATYDDWLTTTAMDVLQLAANERTDDVRARLQAPLRHGGFGLSSASQTASLAYLSSIASSAVLPGEHALAVDAVPPDSQLHSWLSDALSSELVTRLLQSRRHGRLVHPSADSYLAHYRDHPEMASHLQQKLNEAATCTLFNARVERAAADGDVAAVACLKSISAGRAWTWKSVLPTEPAHRLSDEHYRAAARRDLGLQPVSGPMPDVCVACQQDVSNNAYHGLHCKHTKQFATLRHNAVENALAAAARQSACAVVQQAAGLVSSAPGLKPDLLVLTSKGTVVSDVVVSDPMAPSNLPVSVKGSLALANQMAEKKRGKYKVITDALRAEHLPFSVETTGALGETAQEVIKLIAWTAREYGSPWSPEEIKVHLMSSVAVAIQRGNGLALAAAWNKEVEAVLGVVG